jgi:hypothetical protein
METTMSQRTVTCQLTLVYHRKFKLPDTSNAREMNKITEAVLEGLGYPEEDVVQVTVNDLTIQDLA